MWDVVASSGSRYHSVHEGEAKPHTATDSQQWWKPQTKENSSYLAPRTVYLLQAFFRLLFQLQLILLLIILSPVLRMGTRKITVNAQRRGDFVMACTLNVSFDSYSVLMELCWIHFYRHLLKACCMQSNVLGVQRWILPILAHQRLTWLLGRGVRRQNHRSWVAVLCPKVAEHTAWAQGRRGHASSSLSFSQSTRNTAKSYGLLGLPPPKSSCDIGDAIFYPIPF